MIKVDWILEYKGPITISCSKKSSLKPFCAPKQIQIKQARKSLGSFIEVYCAIKCNFEYGWRLTNQKLKYREAQFDFGSLAMTSVTKRKIQLQDMFVDGASKRQHVVSQRKGKD